MTEPHSPLEDYFDKKRKEGKPELSLSIPFRAIKAAFRWLINKLIGRKDHV